MVSDGVARWARRLVVAGGLARPVEAAVTQGRTSRTLLNGVCAAWRNRVNPAVAVTARIRAGPAWVPSASPRGCESDEGVQTSVEKP